MSVLQDLFLNYYFVVALFISFIIYKVIGILTCDDSFMQTKHKLRGHTWRSIQCNKSIPFNNHCLVCSQLMLPLVGLFCECCAVSACKQCYKVINRRQKCKVLSSPFNKPFSHLWVKVGTIALDTPDHIDDNLQKYFCSWCHRSRISQEDQLKSSEQCDFQKYKDFIIPPTSVVLEKGVVKAIRPPDIESWEPLFVFANRKSGSNQGDEILSLFRGLFNPIQVIDLSSTRPEQVMRWMPPRCRVLVAGGDGTVAWVLNALAQADNVHAPVGILPMGTGNDLSRVLSWGAATSSPFCPHSILRAVANAREQPLDRWKITITPLGGRLRRAGAGRTRVVHAYNYASVGVDAQVALDFHEARQLFLYRYASRTINYLAYLAFGATRIAESGCAGLEQRLRVTVKGEGTQEEPLSLPPLQALVLLNIPSWGAGVDLWSLGDDGEVGRQDMSDGKLELAGISSSFHIARLRCGLAQPYRFTQTAHVKIELNKSCAMQVDGEPWMQAPATITVEPGGQVMMLRCDEATS